MIDFFEIPLNFTFEPSASTNDSITIDYILEKWKAACLWDTDAIRLREYEHQYQRNVYEMKIVVNEKVVLCRVYDHPSGYSQVTVFGLTAEDQVDGWQITPDKLTEFTKSFFKK